MVDGIEAVDSMTAVDSKGFQNTRTDSGGFQNAREDSSRGFQHARLIPTYSHSDEEDNEADDCYEDIEEIRRYLLLVFR